MSDYTLLSQVPKISNLANIGELRMVRTRINYSQIDFLSTDVTLGESSASDLLVSSEKAVKSYIDTAINNLPTPMEFKGVIDASSNPNYPAASVGYTYYVSVSGKIGGVSGVSVTSGDIIICNTTNAGGDQATVGADFDIVTGGADASVSSSSTSSTDLDIAVFDGTSGKLIKDGGATIGSLVPKTTTVNGHDLSGNVTVTASDVGLGLLFREATVTATVGQTVINLTHAPIEYSDYIIINGLTSEPELYTITTDLSSNTTVTLYAPCIGGELISIRYMY